MPVVGDEKRRQADIPHMGRLSVHFLWFPSPDLLLLLFTHSSHTWSDHLVTAAYIGKYESREGWIFFLLLLHSYYFSCAVAFHVQQKEPGADEKRQVLLPHPC